MKNEDYLAQIRSLIAHGELEPAIEKFLTYFSNNNHRTQGHDDMVMQSSRYSKLKRGQQNGTLSSDQFSSDTNTIIHKILNLIREEENYLVNNPKPQNPNSGKEFEEDLHLSVTRIKVLEVLLNPQYPEQGLSITDIHKSSLLKSRRRIKQVLDGLEGAGYLEVKRQRDPNLHRLNHEGKNRLSEFLKMMYSEPNS